MFVHLVDGTYELFRQHFAMPSHVTADGAEVAATRGVVGSMLMMLEEGATHVGIATDEQQQCARLGSLGTTGARSVGHVDTMTDGAGVGGTATIEIARAQIDPCGAALHRRHDLLADRAHLSRTGQRREHHVGSDDGGERIGGCAGAESDESVDLDRVEVGHRDVETGFEQVPRHRRAHVAEADERQL